MVSVSKDGETIWGPTQLSHTSEGSLKNLKYQFEEDGKYKIEFRVEGILFQPIPLEKVSFDVIVGNVSNPPNKIPEWVKNTMKWFVESKISENEMINALQFLIREGIIIVEQLDEIEKIPDENQYEVLPREWQTSGPFSLDRSEYALGEKIFLSIDGLNLEDKGQVAVMRPLNVTHYSVYLTIPFDGAQKDSFNYYLDPQLSKTRGLCSVDDVMGKWTLVFRGTNYPSLNFEVTDSMLPGTDWEPVC